MMTFVLNEIKTAVVWVKEVIIRLGAWIFRWILRWTILAALLFLLAKGCCGAFASVFSRLRPDKNVQAVSPVQNSSGQTSSPQAPISYGPENCSAENSPAHRSNSVSTEVRSSWSTLKYVGRDLMRWFRKR
ncbi:MAG TPA: hypothetical protein PLO78_05285 [Candidatus Omnitrophota bacterium]|nr:hypothetical protein [Candidatus Omnitrophota bacterium]